MDNMRTLSHLALSKKKHGWFATGVLFFLVLVFFFSWALSMAMVVVMLCTAMVTIWTIWMMVADATHMALINVVEWTLPRALVVVQLPYITIMVQGTGLVVGWWALTANWTVCMALNRGEVTWTVNVCTQATTIVLSSQPCFPVNCFTGTQLEELKGEILKLCKDQHGCCYLKKRLEEIVPEHRDMIFHETFSHFLELMTGMCMPFFSSANAHIFCFRPFQQLSLPQVTGVFHWWTVQCHLQVSTIQLGHYFIQYAWNLSCSENDRFSVHPSTSETLFPNPQLNTALTGWAQCCALW